MIKKSLQPQDKYILRLPDGWRERIKKAAEENGRSMNAEILARLEETFEGSQRLWDNVNRLEELLIETQRDVKDMKEKVHMLWSRPDPNDQGH